MQYLFHGVLPHHKHEMLPMRLLMGYSWGTLVASYVLLVGYVSRDVKRRKMSAGAVAADRDHDALAGSAPWCISCFASRCSPVVRTARLRSAPAITSVRSASSRWHRSAAQCFRGVEITDVYCKQCGHDLEQDNVPARLRAFRE